MSDIQPSYIETHRSGLLEKKMQKARKAMRSCVLCPRRCKVDRLKGETGVCKTGQRAVVSSFDAHFGEEAPLVGSYGSGTIFFTHCNLLCNFCQNYDISSDGLGTEIGDDRLARMMLSLQDEGCHNVNFVTPSHVVPQILSSLAIAVEEGLRVPLVYNTSAYDSVETLEILEGIVDIYMPDFKFWNPDVAEKTCAAPDYPEVARKALLEMHRQVGDLVLDKRGIARKGLLIRHLVLPEGLAGTRDVMRFIASEVSADSYVNIMAQYRPCGKASEVKALSRRITEDEFMEAIRIAEEEGIKRLDSPRRVFRLVF